MCWTIPWPAPVARQPAKTPETCPVQVILLFIHLFFQTVCIFLIFRVASSQVLLGQSQASCFPAYSFYAKLRSLATGCSCIFRVHESGTISSSYRTLCNKANKCVICVIIMYCVCRILFVWSFPQLLYICWRVPSSKIWMILNLFFVLLFHHYPHSSVSSCFQYSLSSSVQKSFLLLLM